MSPLNDALVIATEICPTPPASLLSEPPKKFAKPPAKMVSARPVTFWLARSVIVRNEKIRPPSIAHAMEQASAITTHRNGLGFAAPDS